MKIIQLLTTISYGDAVGNDTLALQDILLSMGFQTAIYAEHIHPHIKSSRVFHYMDMPGLQSEDILIYHMSTGTQLTYLLGKFRCRKIMIYHNITPPDFFRGYSLSSVKLSQKGIDQVIYLKDEFDYCLADSEYNRQDLLSYGYTCPIDVLPIIIPFADYRRKHNRRTVRKYNDGTVNLMFLGRVAPNKKQEDVIAAFFHYKTKFNPYSRLFLVGSWGGMEVYYGRLQQYVRSLGLTDVYFTGHITFEEMLSYYKLADAFLCMSEHEGFCVPLVEAMLFGIPVVAYAAAAIPSTMNGAGVLLGEKDPLLAAGAVDALLTDEDFRQVIVEGQKKRLDSFSYEAIKAQFMTYLKKFMENGQ